MITGCDRSICVMSGNFLQRGEPAIFDKWLRAEIAVRNGIDLVFELPFAYACNNAEYFAKGAVGLLNSLGCVSDLSFGSETGEIRSLEQAAQAMMDEGPDYSESIRRELKSGVSYAKARYESYRNLMGEHAAAALNNPNNILAVEYIRQCMVLNSDMKLNTIKRTGAGYSEKNIQGNIASATAIRHMMLEESKPIEELSSVIPIETIMAIQSGFSGKLTVWEDFHTLIAYKIISSSHAELNGIFSITEGLENRIKKAVRKSSSVRDLIKGIKSKRYTETRIQRILIHMLLGLTREKMQNMSGKALYARVLAMNENGAAILKDIRNSECASIPILTNINREADKYPDIGELLDLDILASDIYNLAGSKPIHMNSDHVKKPYYQSIQDIKQKRIEKNHF